MGGVRRNEVERPRKRMRDRYKKSERGTEREKKRGGKGGRKWEEKGRRGRVDRDRWLNPVYRWDTQVT